MKKIYIILILLLSIIGVQQVKSQGIALKTNLGGWVVFAPNIGVDLSVSECSSIEAVFYKSALDSWLKKANFTSLQLGYKYWFSRTPMNSFFLGVNATVVKYKAVINNTDRKGYAYPFGVVGGYCLPLGKRFNIEFSYGIGATYLNEEVYSPNEEFESWSRHNMSFTPTNISINVSYIIK